MNELLYCGKRKMSFEDMAILAEGHYIWSLSSKSSSETFCFLASTCDIKQAGALYILIVHDAHHSSASGVQNAQFSKAPRDLQRDFSFILNRNLNCGKYHRQLLRSVRWMFCCVWIGHTYDMGL